MLLGGFLVTSQKAKELSILLPPILAGWTIFTDIDEVHSPVPYLYFSFAMYM